MTSGNRVWSSVLGTSLTTVKADGGQIETKVFAGGAHIATQNGDGSESLTFRTADPLTGTVAVFGGSTSGGGKEEESEPLGQQIERFDPGGGDHTTYSQVLNKAQDPEWQCISASLSGSELREMPVHCQKNAGPASKTEIQISFGDSRKEESPANAVEGPGQGIRPTLKTPERLKSEDLRRAKELAATLKPSEMDNETFVAMGPSDIPGMVDASEESNMAVLPDGYSSCTLFALKIGIATASGSQLVNGRALGGQAKNFYSKSKDSSGNNLFGIDGFKEMLIEGRQGADVYKHVAGAIGATLIGKNRVDPSGIAGEMRTGREVLNDQNNDDINQANNPTPYHTRSEALAELAGNAVGEVIGNKILQITENSRDARSLSA